MVTGVGVFMYGFTTIARTVVEEGAFRAVVQRQRKRANFAGPAPPPLFHPIRSEADAWIFPR